VVESVVIEPTARGERSFAGRTVRVAALLLLFGLLAPPGVSPGPPAAPGDPSSHGGRIEDNSAALPAKDRFSQGLFSLPGITNVGHVAPGIVRGAQPEPEGYATLKEIGIRTVVNLRTRHGEREAVEAAGMRYVEIPMSFLKKVDPAAIRKALSVMTDPANQPVFLHCSRGKDRAGVVVAVYRMEVDGWSEAEAVAEMEALGFHEIWFQLKKTVQEWRSGG
jgi:protein tyrosine phosphatase (PTP) superfamily phosphohydrolase (DUF442 family)